MFFGKFSLPLRNKNELTLPSGFRPEMRRIAYLTRGFDRNLLLLSQEIFNAFSSHLRSISISDPLSRLLRRLFLGGAVEVIVADDGRIVLPSDLCDYAGLDGEIILVGQGDYLEIWSPPNWQEQMENLADPEANMDRFTKFNLAII